MKEEIKYKMIKGKFIKGDTCYRCGESKKELRKPGGCEVYGTYHGNHLFTIN